MADLQLELEKARAEVARIQDKIARGPCREHGHDWEHIGGMNASCANEYCSCSVPVHRCKKCGDYDYGENAEASRIRAKCAALD